MSYKELKSLYYGNNELYAQEYLNRFNSEETIKLNFQIGKHRAFFMQNAEVMTLAYKIARLDKEIENLCNTLPGAAINQYSKKLSTLSLAPASTVLLWVQLYLQQAVV